ncbi:hypothetical protein RJT34_03004 [Clitoria ternatea]|uniref:Uncharacterized protein n=1 Tax=Clitoria ternatea TaxID=43366 RepID=A0AAN9PZE5_CLITE
MMCDFKDHWTTRKRRTRKCRKTKPSRATATPTTPLSWTATTSVDGYKGSARSTRPVHDSGSKVRFWLVLKDSGRSCRSCLRRTANNNLGKPTLISMLNTAHDDL